MAEDAPTTPPITVPELLQGAWTSFVVLTYGADLGFLERRLLSQLSHVPLRVILADHVRLATVFAEAATTGQRLKMANRTYLAGPIRHPRAAHAKAIFLASENEGLLLVGSGNLSQDGYASQGELWHVFAYQDGRPDHLPEFVTLRGMVDELSENGALDSPTRQYLDLVWSHCSWLPKATSYAPQRIHHNLHYSLIEQFANAVDFDIEVATIYAPFHDPDCAAISQLIDRFRPALLRVFLTRGTSVNGDRLSEVLSAVPSESFVAEVRDDPRTYLHAKWIHLVGPESEAMLAGSANLSRSALLHPAGAGNIEIGVIDIGRRGEFEHLYEPLNLTQVDSVSDLGLAFHSNPDPVTDPGLPVLLWSRLDGTALTLAFDRPIAQTALTFSSPTGPIAYVRLDFKGSTVSATLEPQQAATLAEGGYIYVTLNGSSTATWPYQLNTLRGRLERAANSDLLAKSGDLPAEDAELFQLLQELERTLIFDPVSAWRVAKPKTEAAVEDMDGTALRWEDLDWERIRRHPRYWAYHYRGSREAPNPTDIQVILAAIAGRLGEIDAPASSSSDDDLAIPGDTTTATEEDPDDEPEEAGPARRLSVTTRTRMAFNRFVTRFAAAIRDKGFIEQLGPVLAVHNAAILNHLLLQLLIRDAVDPVRALTAQVATWEFLWGTSANNPGIVGQLGGEEHAAVIQVIEDTHSRVTTLRALSHEHVDDLPPELRSELRSIVRHLIVDPIFDFRIELVRDAAPDPQQAAALINELQLLAGFQDDREIAQFVVEPLGGTSRDVEWRAEQVNRINTATGKSGEYRSETLVVHRHVDGLDGNTAREALERFAVATEFAGTPRNYWRIKFAGNRGDIAFWDGACSRGVIIAGTDDFDFDHFQPKLPEWMRRLKSVDISVAA